MLAVLGGYWLFSAFIDSEQPTSLGWLNVYYVLAGACLLCLLLSQAMRVELPPDYVSRKSLLEDFIDMLSLCLKPLVLIFVASAFLYVLIEQSIQTWLPTFNHEVFHLPSALSVQVTGIFAVCVAIGRLSASWVSRHVHWFALINGCLLGALVLVIVVLPLARAGSETAASSWASLPLAALLLPLVGLFLAPIYPVLNSVILSALPKAMQAAMTGLIVVSSALGGTLGSLITGQVFAAFSGIAAFYTTLLPIALLALLSLLLWRQLREGEKGAGRHLTGRV
jgi:fucose permease